MSSTRGVCSSTRAGAVPACRVGDRRGPWRASTAGLDPAHRAIRVPDRLLLDRTGGDRRPAGPRLTGWQKLRYEVTEDATSSRQGERYAYTPTLGVFCAVTGQHGDILVPEDRLRHAMMTANSGGRDLHSALEILLGKEWDDELEPFRYAGDDAPVRWLHQVV